MDLLLGGLDGLVLGAVALLLLVGVTVGAARSALPRRAALQSASPTGPSTPPPADAPARRGQPTDTHGHPRRPRAPGTA